MSNGGRRFYEFGPFRLDAAGQRLLRDDEEVVLRDNGEGEKLPPKAFDLLLFMVEHPGELHSRDRIMEAVWPGTSVEEQQITSNVSTLRKFLGDAPKNSAYIETVPKRGYRFVADVREVAEEPVALFESAREQTVVEYEYGPGESAPAATGGPRELPPGEARAGRSSRRLAAFAALACLLVAVPVAYVFLARRGAAPAATRVAVLPFKPLVAGSSDPALELGMTDALIMKLSNVRQVTVRPTNSVIKFAGEGQDLRAAGRELEVDVLLDGRVQKVGDRIRLSVQLVRAADGVPVWAEKFDEEFRDIFAVQDSISEQVASALALRLSGEERRGLAKRYTENVEAYRLYVQGRQHWATFTREGREKSINYYHEALRLDPDYALAHTGLAATYIVIGIYGPETPAEVIPKAREAVDRALELDEELAQAHVASAAFKLLYEHDWPGAERELKRATELSPHHPDTYALYGYYLTATGRTEEAVVYHRRAKELAPQWHIHLQDLLDALFLARRYDEALEQSREVLRLEPDDDFTAWVLMKSLNMKGLHGEAAAEALGRLDSPGTDEHMRRRLLSELGYSYAASGKRAEAASVIERLKAQPDPWLPVQLAKIHAGLGEHDQAFAWLSKAADDLFPFLYEVRAEAHFDGLRADPRYAGLLRRINLTP